MPVRGGCCCCGPAWTQLLGAHSQGLGGGSNEGPATVLACGPVGCQAGPSFRLWRARRLPEGLADKELEGRVRRQLTARWSRLEAAPPGHGASGTWRGDACAPAVFLHLFHPVARPAEPPSLLPRPGECLCCTDVDTVTGRGKGPVPGREAQMSCPSASCRDSAVPEAQLPLPGPRLLPRPCRSDLVPVRGSPG